MGAGRDARGAAARAGVGAGSSARGAGRGDSGGGKGADGALVTAVSPMAMSGVAEAARVKSRDNAESNPAAAERSDRPHATVRDSTPARSTRAAGTLAVF